MLNKKTTPSLQYVKFRIVLFIEDTTSSIVLFINNSTIRITSIRGQNVKLLILFRKKRCDFYVLSIKNKIYTFCYIVIVPLYFVTVSFLSPAYAEHTAFVLYL